MATEIHCHIKNNSSSDLILDGKEIKAKGFAHFGSGDYGWDKEPPGKIPANGGEGYFSATNVTALSYIGVTAKYKASVDGFTVNINFSAWNSTHIGGDRRQEAELSKKDIINVREKAGGTGSRQVRWTITDYPD
jgi:hypothetical protein